MNRLKALGLGVVAAILAQTLIAMAETWSFGPSLAPLKFVFGGFTWPVITAVTLGVPIAAVYFAASRLVGQGSRVATLVLVGPFAALQLLSLRSAELNSFTVFYIFSFIAIATLAAQLRGGFKQSRS